MFWTFNLSFDILATVWSTSPNIGRIFVRFSGHSALSLPFKLSVIKVNVVMLNVILLNVSMPHVTYYILLWCNVINLSNRIQKCFYDKICCSGYHYAECSYAEWGLSPKRVWSFRDSLSCFLPTFLSIWDVSDIATFLSPVSTLF